MLLPSSMKNINLNLEINLKKFSSLALGEALWESAVIKNEIRTYGIKIFDMEGDDRENEKKWRNVIQRVINILESLHLQDDLLKKVESAIVFLGEKVFNWFTCFIKSAGSTPLEYVYLPKIHWTQHGVIDDYKIYKSWRKHPMGPLKFLESPYCDMPGFDQSKLLPYAIACTYADKKFIQESLPKIATLIKKVLGIKIMVLTRFKVSKAMSILLVWYKTLINTDFNFSSEYSKLKSKDYPKGFDKMFLHCASMGMKRSAEYFYRKLKETDRQSIIRQAALECLSETFMNGQVVLHNSCTEKTPEMLLYLLRKMTNERRKIFLSDKIAEVYTTFLYTWPYQELCIPLLDYFWVNISKMNRLRILQANFTLLKHNSEIKHYAFTSTIYQPLTKSLLAKTPYDLKKFIFPNSNIIFNLFKIPDFSSIDVVLEDPDCKALREEIIDIGKFFPGYWILKGGSTKNIKDYMTHFKVSPVGKKNLLKFSKDPTILNFLIESGRFDEADDILDWRCSNQKELMKLKKEMKENSVDVCSEYIKAGKYDLIEKYLKWLFRDDHRALSNVKKKIWSVEFIRIQFWIVWLTNRKEGLQSAKNKSLKFLKYFFRTEEKVNWFRRERIVKNENFVKSVLDAADSFDFSSNFSIDFDEIMEFCSVPTTKINKINEKIGNKIIWFFQLVQTPEEFIVLSTLVNWISDCEGRNRIFNLLLLNSTKVAALYLLFSKLSEYDETFREANRIMLKEWIKPHGDIEKLKNLLDEAKGVRVELTEVDILRAKYLLDNSGTSWVISLLKICVFLIFCYWLFSFF